MLQFIKDSVRELKHVVWPTYAETKKYFLIVVVVLTLFGAYLFIASTVFSEILYGIKGMVSGNDVTISSPEISVENIETQTATQEATQEETTTPVVEETQEENTATPAE